MSSNTFPILRGIEIPKKLIYFSMTKITRYIPSFITCLSLISGFVALIHAFNGSFSQSLVWVIIASVFDFMDGFAARIFNAVSEFGKQLDSLSDAISFGVVPGVFGFVFMLDIFGVGSVNNLASIGGLDVLLLAPPALITVFSALRLAKFNIDTRQSDHFVGLPTPANALLVLSFILYVSTEGFATVDKALSYIAFSMFFLMSAIVLILPIDLLALKFKNFRFAENWHRYLIIFSGVTGVILLGLSALFMVILFYILLSVIVWFVKMPAKS